MPGEVIVNKDELMAVLRDNRERHRAAYLAARKGYTRRIIAELESCLESARAGRDVRLPASLPVPRDHTSDYDREIRMLEMHRDALVTIESALFDQVVMDRWSWSDNFRATNSAYALEDEDW